MRLFSYVVARDYGFAPNPFCGVCTLATCKPRIREHAHVGDWIAGIASAGDNRTPSLVYVMRVDEVLTYDAYWADPRFQGKKPSRTSGVKHLFGDNIYHHNGSGKWVQVDSHHSLEDGSPNQCNIDNDTQSEGVLVGRRFAYWGSSAIPIPEQLLDHGGESLLVRRGHKNQFSAPFVAAFVAWFESLNVQGFVAPPYMWQRPGAIWARVEA